MDGNGRGWIQNGRIAISTVQVEINPSNPSEGRWDSDFCRAYGLGYSPLNGNQFLAYAKKKGLKMDVLLQLGLIGEDEHHPGNYYDFYRGRLMIPQRDRFGKIVTFTARTLNPQATVKYLNGKDCAIYKKSTSIFGIDIALKAARSEERRVGKECRL